LVRRAYLLGREERMRLVAGGGLSELNQEGKKAHGERNGMGEGRTRG